MTLRSLQWYARNRVTDRRSAIAGYGLVTLFWAAQVCVHLWWLKIDTRPPTYDSAGHAVKAVLLARAVSNIDPLAVGRTFWGVQPYPPFGYLTSVPFAILQGPTLDALLGAQVFFLGVLFLSTYELGFRLERPFVGLMATFLLGLYPIIYGLSRFYLLDIPLVAMVTLAICCLTRSKDFNRRVPSVLFGVSLGLGMLTKWTFAVFVGPLFVMSTLKVIREFSDARLRNWLVAVLLGGLISGPWYLIHLEDLWSFFQRNQVYSSALEGDPLISSRQAWIWYADALINHQILLPLSVLWIIGLALLLVKRRLDRSALFLLLWILVPYVAFSVFANKNVRYVLPYLPAIALMTALGLGQIRSARLAVVVSAVVVVYSLVQFSGLSFGLSHRVGTGWLPGTVLLRLGAVQLTLYREDVHGASPPRATDWHVEEILQRALQDADPDQGEGDGIRLLVVPNRPNFEPESFRFYAIAADLPVRVRSITGARDKDAAGELEASDYVVIKSGYLGPAWSLQDALALTQALQGPHSDVGRRFTQVGEYRLPDDSIAQLYRHDRTDH